VQLAMATNGGDSADPAGISDDLLCSICTTAFLDPKAFRCGHAFCGPCIQHWLKRSSRCPMCRTEVQASELVDCSALRAECDRLSVLCPWQCGWYGRRDELATHTTVCHVGYFIDATVPVPGGHLGINFEIIEGRMFVGSVDHDGAIDRYNRKQGGCEEKQVRSNDQVVQVDGIGGDARVLSYLVQRAGRKSITFRHPEELAINLNTQGKKLGLDISWTQKCKILTILGVDGGAADECNSAAKTESEKLMRLDRIIEVNGVSCVGSPERVMPILNQAQHSNKCLIRIHRPRRCSVCSL